MLLKLRLMAAFSLPVCLFSYAPPALIAQDKSPDVTVQVDVGQLQASKLGSQLIDFAKSQAQQEMGSNLNWKDVEQSLGFDPFKEIESVHVATSIESPDKTAVVSVNFKSTTGNLEGLMLATPNYETSKHNQSTIHSTDLDGKRIFAVIVANPGGGKSVHLSLDQSNLKSLLDSQGKQSLSSSDTSNSGKIVQVHVADFPEEVLGDGPHTNVVKLLKSLDVSAGESGDDFQIDLRLSVVDEEKAEQIRQIAQGLVGALSLASSMDSEDTELSKFKDFVKSLEAKRDGDKVNVNLVVNGDQVTKIISEELK
jgi:hypothetical protein